MRRGLLPIVGLWLALSVALAGCARSASYPAVAPKPIAGAAKPATNEPSHGDAAAVVNGERVPAWEFEALLRLNQQNDPGASVSGARASAGSALAALRARTVRQIVDEALLNAYAASHELAVRQAVVDAQLEVYRLQSGASFAASLARLGVTGVEFRRMVWRNLNAQAVTQHIINAIPAPAERVQVVQVVVRSLARARVVQAQLNQGMSPALLAVRESSDASLRRQAGQLPPLTRAEGDVMFGPQWSALVFALRPGSIGNPVHLRDGWAVVQVVERQPSTELMQRAMDGLVAGLRRTARITTYVH